MRTHEPGGTPLGDELRQLFLDPRWGAVDGTVELLMLIASRRHHLLEVIDPALRAGKVVLCDRFTDSTHAYQSGGRGVPAELIAELDRRPAAGRHDALRAAGGGGAGAARYSHLANANRREVAARLLTIEGIG